MTGILRYDQTKLKISLTDLRQIKDEKSFLSSTWSMRLLHFFLKQIHVHIVIKRIVIFHPDLFFVCATLRCLTNMYMYINTIYIHVQVLSLKTKSTFEFMFFSRYFCYVDLNETEQSIEEVKKDILHTSQYALGGTEGLTWPLGKLPINIFSKKGSSWIPLGS